MTSHPKLRLLGLPALTHRALELRVTLTPSAYIACVQRFLTVTGKEAISYAVQIALVLSLEPAFKCLIDQSHLLFGPSISQWLVLCSHSKTGLQVQLIPCFVKVNKNTFCMSCLALFCIFLISLASPCQTPSWIFSTVEFFRDLWITLVKLQAGEMIMLISEKASK